MTQHLRATDVDQESRSSIITHVTSLRLNITIGYDSLLQSLNLANPVPHRN